MWGDDVKPPYERHAAELMLLSWSTLGNRIMLPAGGASGIAVTPEDHLRKLGPETPGANSNALPCNQSSEVPTDASMAACLRRSRRGPAEKDGPDGSDGQS